MKEKLTIFNASEYLSTPEDIAHFITDALETNDQKYITHASKVVVKALSMTPLAQETCLTKGHLYTSFNKKGNLTLKTQLAVSNVLGVSLSAIPVNDVSLKASPKL